MVAIIERKVFAKNPILQKEELKQNGSSMAIMNKMQVDLENYVHSYPLFVIYFGSECKNISEILIQFNSYQKPIQGNVHIPLPSCLAIPTPIPKLWKLVTYVV